MNKILKGILKLLGCTLILASTPTAICIGKKIENDGLEEKAKIHAAFQETEEFKQADNAKNDALIFLEENKFSGLLTPESYNNDIEYYHSEKWIDDVIYSNPEFSEALKEADEKIKLGNNIALSLGITGAIGTVGGLGIYGCITQGIPFVDGVKDIKEGIKGKKRKGSYQVVVVSRDGEVLSREEYE